VKSNLIRNGKHPSDAAKISGPHPTLNAKWRISIREKITTWTNCLNAKSKRSTRCYKKLNSAPKLIQRTTSDVVGDGLPEEWLRVRHDAVMFITALRGPRFAGKRSRSNERG
jgi:hypothetical protein